MENKIQCASCNEQKAQKLFYKSSSGKIDQQCMRCRVSARFARNTNMTASADAADEAQKIKIRLPRKPLPRHCPGCVKCKNADQFYKKDIERQDALCKSCCEIKRWEKKRTFPLEKPEDYIVVKPGTQYTFKDADVSIWEEDAGRKLEESEKDEIRTNVAGHINVLISSHYSKPDAPLLVIEKNPRKNPQANKERNEQPI